MRILVVCESQIVRRIITNCLAGLPELRIEMASDGPTTMSALGHGSFDLVIADSILSSIDGIALIQKIRAHPLHGALPAILLAETLDTSRIAAAVKSGVSHVVLMPFKAETLRSKVTACVKLVPMTAAHAN